MNVLSSLFARKSSSSPQDWGQGDVDPSLSTSPAAAADEAIGAAAEPALHLDSSISAFVAHHDPEVRAAALTALCRLGRISPESFDPVVRALSDEVDLVRAHAARVAALLPANVVVECLSPLVDDPSWLVRCSAVATLVGLDPSLPPSPATGPPTLRIVD